MNYDCQAVSLGLLLKEVEKFSDKYTFMIDTNPEGNIVYLSKDGIDLFDYGGHVSLETALHKCLEYIYRINKTNDEEIKIYECLMCGEILDHVGRFCSEDCAQEYYYQNRTCETCGGEFWDGGTSCTCENWDDDETEEENFQPCANCPHNEACEDFGCYMELDPNSAEEDNNPNDSRNL